MNEENVEISVINGVKITKQGDKTHFEPIDQGIEKDIKIENKSPLTRIWDWYRKSKIKPYINTRDLNNSSNEYGHEEENKPKSAVEIGLKVEF